MISVLQECWSLCGDCSRYTLTHGGSLAGHQYPSGTRAAEVPRQDSLVAQWIRIHLAMQGKLVRSLFWEDSTCCGATKSVSQNYWAWALKPMSQQLLSPHDATTEAHVPKACAPQQEQPLQWEDCTPQPRVGPARCNYRKPAEKKQRRPSAAKNKKNPSHYCWPQVSPLQVSWTSPSAKILTAFTSHMSLHANWMWAEVHVVEASAVW